MGSNEEEEVLLNQYRYQIQTVFKHKSLDLMLARLDIGTECRLMRYQQTGKQLSKLEITCTPFLLKATFGPCIISSSILFLELPARIGASLPRSRPANQCPVALDPPSQLPHHCSLHIVARGYASRNWSFTITPSPLTCRDTWPLRVIRQVAPSSTI